MIQKKIYNDRFIFVEELNLDEFIRSWIDDSEQNGRIYTLKSTNNDLIVNKELFFDAVLNSLPISHTVPYGAWSALADVVWDGINSLGIDRLALIWPEIDKLPQESLPTLIHGLMFFKNEFDNLKIKYGAEKDLIYKIFLVSESKKFNEWFLS